MIVESDGGVEEVWRVARQCCGGVEVASRRRESRRREAEEHPGLAEVLPVAELQVEGAQVDHAVLLDPLVGCVLLGDVLHDGRLQRLRGDGALLLALAGDVDEAVLQQEVQVPVGPPMAALSAGNQLVG